MTTPPPKTGNPSERVDGVKKGKGGVGHSAQEGIYGGIPILFVVPTQVIASDRGTVWEERCGQRKSESKGKT